MKALPEQPAKPLHICRTDIRIPLSRSRLPGEWIESKRSIILKGTTRLLVSSTKVNDKRGRIREYERFFVHIPSSIAKDSQFTFKAGQKLVINVAPKREDRSKGLAQPIIDTKYYTCVKG